MPISRLLGSLGQDVRYALRGLRRSPAFTAVALTLLALGIGANTAIFSFVNAVLLKQLPVVDPTRLVTFSRETPRGPVGVVWSLNALDEVSKRVPALSGVFGWALMPVNLSEVSSARWVKGEMVTGQYFRTLQVRAAIGRLLSEDDVRDALGDPVCVLSYGFWQRGFGGDPAVVGRTVQLNGQAYRVIGVTEQRFFGADLQRQFDIALPATRIGDFMPMFAGPGGGERARNMGWLAPMARLAPGSTRAEAENQTQVLLRELDRRSLPELHVQDAGQGFNTMRPAFGRPVLVLMGVVALVLLVACANLAHLLVARAQARSREFAVRLSMGASRARLIGQLLVESVLLAIGGGLAGVGLSFWITGTVVSFLNAGRPPTSALQVAPDVYVLAFSALLSITTVLLFGLAPAWHATHPDLVQDLKQDSTTSGVSGRLWLPRALVVTQVTASLVLVFSAGLLTRTLQELASGDLGYDPRSVIALSVDPASAGYSGARAISVLDDILNRARDLPGVRVASMASSTPRGAMLTNNVTVPGYVPQQAGDGIVGFSFVSPHYFATLGQASLGGRDFDDRDQENSMRVAVVNQAFVDRYLNGRDPLGVRVTQRQGREQFPIEMAIVGVVEDARYDIRSRPIETVYLPLRQAPPSAPTLLLRTDDDPQRVIPSLAAIVESIDPRMPIFSVQTLEGEVNAGLSSERMLGYFSALFALLATVVAAIGLHGLLALSVSRRARELGIRMAVGAQRRDVVTLFGRESFVLVLVGIGIGVPLALVSARLLGSLLFGVPTNDPRSLAGSIAVLLSATLLATLPSLWRASRSDPATAIRRE